MFRFIQIAFTLFFISYLWGGTPLDYTIGFTGGYDDNVLRFSKDEFNDAAQDLSIMGGSTTFDSFVTKLSFQATKSIIYSKYQNLDLKLLFTSSDYRNTPEKKYWSGGFDIAYKWGSYKNIKYSLRHLDRFYLRHYTNRDISNDKLSPCLFTDRNQSLMLSQRISKLSWMNFGGGYLQRYYSKPFTEFDLDIVYYKAKLNYKIKKIGNVALQVNHGRAVNESHFLPERPSSFNRSYETIEWYAPIKINKKVPFFSEIGFSTRLEKRVYDAEDPNDPLHSGRSHLDSKYDIWLKKNITEIVNITFSTRYRTRQTDSEYDWVKDLKSFEQMQFWLTLKWDMIYDIY